MSESKEIAKRLSDELLQEVERVLTKMISDLDQKGCELLVQIDNKYYEDKRNSYDEEMSHQDADEVLCTLLSTIGLTDTVKMFRTVPKYYS